MKVSLYLEDELWKRFKKRLLQRAGDARVLSKEVQALLRESIVEDELKAGFELMKIETKLITPDQVEAVTPSVPTSSARTLKDMRRRLG